MTEAPARSMPVDAVPALLAALERRSPATGDRFDEMSRYAVLPPGKLLRPMLLIASAEAVGGTCEAVLPAAVAVEHLHAASLVHDDIIDGDRTRRGRSSVYARYGVPDAIVTGDALIFDLFATVAECDAPQAAVLAAVTTIARSGADLCRGQVQESQLVAPGSDGPGSGLEAYLEVAALKTGALFRAACRTGALLGGGTEGEADLLTAYAEHTGLAFQLYDDLLPFLADAADTGKPARSDAANLRATYPVLLAHRAGDPNQRRAVEAALSGALPTAERLAVLRDVVVETGALELAVRGAREHVERATRRLGELPGTAAARRLARTAEFAVHRDR